MYVAIGGLLLTTKQMIRSSIHNKWEGYYQKNIRIKSQQKRLVGAVNRKMSHKINTWENKN